MDHFLSIKVIKFDIILITTWLLFPVFDELEKQIPLIKFLTNFRGRIFEFNFKNGVYPYFYKGL